MLMCFCLNSLYVYLFCFYGEFFFFYDNLCLDGKRGYFGESGGSLVITTSKDCLKTARTLIQVGPYFSKCDLQTTTPVCSVITKTFQHIAVSV